MAKHRFIKHPGSLVPADADAEQWLTRKKVGALIEVEAVEPRNAKLLRKWWSLCSFLAEHGSQFPTAEHASKWILIQTGFCTEIRTRRGVERIADSISFANMTDDEFNVVYGKACDLLCEILPNVTDKTVRQVLAEYANVGWMESAR